MKIILNEKDAEKIAVEYIKGKKYGKNKGVENCLKGIFSIFMLMASIDMICDISNMDWDKFKKIYFNIRL